MSTARKLTPVSVDEYLSGELRSAIKHEYLGGVVYGMAGASNAHNIIKGNIFASLHQQLQGRPCRPFDSDTKIRIRMPTQVRFYYPDVSVVCRPNPQDDLFQDEPTVIVEVLSRETRRTDEGEKKDAYLTIPALVAYLLVEQNSPSLVVFCRTEQGFVGQTYEGADAVVPLAEIGAELRLDQVYAGIELRE
jgi:Uma2 family endonuclease